MHRQEPPSTWMTRVARVVFLVLGTVVLFQFHLSPACAQDTESLPSPLRLEQAVQLARVHRPEIAAAQARARAFAERPAIVSALDDPMISPAVDHLPFMLDGADVSFTVEQRFPLSGIRGNRRRVAEAESQGAKADIDKVSLDVELDATEAFLMLQERRGMVSVLEEQRTLAQQFVRAATARYGAGTGGQSEALRAEIEVSRLDGALRSMGSEVRAAEVMLNSSLGRPADAPVPALDRSISTLVPRRMLFERLPSPGGRSCARATRKSAVLRQKSLSCNRCIRPWRSFVRVPPTP